MKYLLIIGDGMADYQFEELGGRTPLEVAVKPNMDMLAQKGRCGKFLSIPPGLPAGSEVANLSILGYNPKTCLEGRGVLEAASMGVEVLEQDVVLRCNLICVEQGKIKNHSAGNISNEEASEIIRDVNKNFGNDKIRFFPGVSYRHVLLLRGKEFSKHLKTFPPHDEIGKPINDILIWALNKKAEETEKLLNGLIIESNIFLENHPVNIKRNVMGKDKANYLWPWSPGKKLKMRNFADKFGKSGAVISAVDLIKGTAVYAGLKPIYVEGATGIYTTNYEAKAKAALEQLKYFDFVLVHVEASDEASHEGNLELKIKTIEYLDQRLLWNIMKGIESMPDNVSLAVLPDHYTPITKRTHSSEAVPFLIYKPGISGDGVTSFNEKSVEDGFYGLLKGEEFIKAFLS